MSENPSDGLGGGFDMGALLEQAQQMQAQIQAAQERLNEAEVTGSSAGGAVAVTINGIGELQGVQIGSGAVDPQDAESLADLGDLIVAAYRDAKARADAMAAETLGPLAGGLGDGLPGLG